MKKFKVVVYKEVREKLLTFAKFIARVNSDSAHRFIEKFEKAIESLSTLPIRGNLLDTSKEYRKINISKHYALIYLIKNDRVHIIDIIDFRQFQ